MADGWPDAPAIGTYMTLGEGVRRLSPNRLGWACACSGPAWEGDRLCGCHRATVEARALKRGAHILARLLSDTAQRGHGG